MKERDEAAEATQRIAAVGGSVVVTLHANLNDKEIQLAVARWMGKPVTLTLVEDDSTPEQRADFRRRWAAAGGGAIEQSK
jgi:hypothetical protein